jgi:signal transduction histidine kinase
MADPFDRFARGGRDAGKPGHGLGLALVRAIATRHGARLSRPATDAGLTIDIAFPALAQPAAA